MTRITSPNTYTGFATGLGRTRPDSPAAQGNGTLLPSGLPPQAEGTSPPVKPFRRGEDASSTDLQSANNRSDDNAKTPEEDSADTAANGAFAADPDSELIKALTERDVEVRQHEAAHSAAGGSYIRGSASYSYQTGPNGKRYAVGGEVQIDTAPVPGDPAATIQKARAIRRAALAPAEPSSADRAVAAAAAQMEAEARIELARQQFDGSDLTTRTPELTESDADTESATETSQQSPQSLLTRAAYIRNLEYSQSLTGTFESYV